MGFMGISHFEESDMASDVAGSIADSITDIFKEELKNEANEYNTDGALNIAMIISGTDLEPFFWLHEDLIPILEEVIEKVENRWDKKNEDIIRHLNAVRKLKDIIHYNCG